MIASEKLLQFIFSIITEDVFPPKDAYSSRKAEILVEVCLVSGLYELIINMVPSLTLLTAA